MGYIADPCALLLGALYGLLAVGCFYQMVLMRRARHSGSFFVVLSLACLMCLLRAAFFLKTCAVAGGKDIASYSSIVGVYLLPYALFFTMNSALVVYYSQAVAKADSRSGSHARSLTSSTGTRVSTDGTRTGLFWMTVWMSLVYVAFISFLALVGPERGPKVLRWFYLLWTSVSDVVICGLIKVWGDRFSKTAPRAPMPRTVQFEVLNAILCGALFGHAAFAILCYAEVLPRNVTYVYFMGHHSPLSAARTAVFVATEACLLYTSPSPRDRTRSRMPSSA